MTHQKGPLVPIKHRFNLVTVCIESQDELNTPYHSAISDLLRSSQRAAHREAGKIELGNEFSGIGHYLLVAAFETPTHGLHQPAATMIPKTFSIDKRHARARGFPQWWLLLRSYVEKGQRIKFCCGRIGNVPGVTDDVCCCGGWVHDEEAKVSQIGPYPSDIDSHCNSFRSGYLHGTQRRFERRSRLMRRQSEQSEG